MTAPPPRVTVAAGDSRLATVIEVRAQDAPAPRAHPRSAASRVSATFVASVVVRGTPVPSVT
ncbi:hypothetical protein EAO71_24080 [Streptomyces sp. ms191]|nr:hypothetical protein EAO71_24080 [Streptomyces sp. ms191]